jgi:DNA-binding protein HU-beta
VNKTELVDAIAGDTGLTKVDAQAALDAFTSVVAKQLKKGDEVAITGFGKFSVTKRAARTGRNPQTGESLKIKASKAPKFSPGAGLRTAVTGKARTK